MSKLLSREVLRQRTSDGFAENIIVQFIASIISL